MKLMDTWLEASPAPPNLFIRIAVREIESWLLADHGAVRQLIGGKGKLPPQPDALPDPKSHLLQPAKLAGRDIRADLVKEKGAMASQGMGYNARLSTRPASSWSAERAPSPFTKPGTHPLSSAGTGLSFSFHPCMKVWIGTLAAPPPQPSRP